MKQLVVKKCTISFFDRPITVPFNLLRVPSTPSLYIVHPFSSRRFLPCLTLPVLRIYPGIPFVSSSFHVFLSLSCSLFLSLSLSIPPFSPTLPYLRPSSSGTHLRGMRTRRRNVGVANARLSIAGVGVSSTRWRPRRIGAVGGFPPRRRRPFCACNAARICADIYRVSFVRGLFPPFAVSPANILSVRGLALRPLRMPSASALPRFCARGEIEGRHETGGVIYPPRHPKSQSRNSPVQRPVQQRLRYPACPTYRESSNDHLISKKCLYILNFVFILTSATSFTAFNQFLFLL